MPASNQLDALREQRRGALHMNARQIGIDFIEVEAGDGVWQLTVNLVPAIDRAARKYDVLREITVANLLIRDAQGMPTSELIIESLQTAAPRSVRSGHSDATGSAYAFILRVRVADAEAFRRSRNLSRTYTLELINVPNVDRFFSRAPFSFRTGASAIDPRSLESSDDDLQPIVQIDYLAKDYASFRKLMLDQLSLSAPSWQERHAADIGVMLVEVMAYAADYLSYYQDAVATEAYLTTARRRISLRRHARLLDYPVHEGCNARMWVHFEIEAPLSLPLPQSTQVLTYTPRFDLNIPSALLDAALADDPIVFETMYPVDLYTEHNRMSLYAWGASEYWLDQGATRATLDGHFPNLLAGDVLIFHETTGGDIDPERSRCHAVRLTEQPNATTDPLYDDWRVTEIRWHPDDALPFRLLVNPAGNNIPNTIVLGNNVLADHGLTINDEKLPRVPDAGLYNLKFQFTDLTFATAFDPEAALSRSASAATEQKPDEAVPAVKLREIGDEGDGERQPGALDEELHWQARPDLLSSGPFAQDFVIETETDGCIYARFGDGVYGARPDRGTRFEATYRVGQYRLGNIGPGALAHVVDADAFITSVHNPLAATGGTDPETLNHIRLNAPEAFRGQPQRCVTEDDYVTVAEGYPGVQNARARIHWTGSWPTIFIYVQRQDGLPLTDDYRADLLAYLDEFRLIGHDLEIRGPHYVPLEIVLTVHVDSAHSKNAVRNRLHSVFSNVRLPGGERGFFHPENFTFGQSVYLSQIIAAAMKVAGVSRVEPREFQRLDQLGRSKATLAAREIAIRPVEVARLDNDPQLPANGTIRFNLMRGEV